VVENLSVSSTVTFNGVLTGTLRINHPTTPGQLLGSGNVVTTASSILSTYDGMADFGGTSGRTYLGTTTRTSSFTVTTGLAPWIGATGSDDAAHRYQPIQLRRQPGRQFAVRLYRGSFGVCHRDISV
jgi:hypothetical protein